MALDDSYIQVAHDSTGKKVRNLTAQVVGAGGGISTVFMQVVSLADEFGNPVEFQDNDAWQTQMLDEMRAVRLGIQTLLDEGNQHKARQVNLLEWSQTIRSDEDY